MFVEMAQDVADGGVHELVRKHAVLDLAGAADRCACVMAPTPNPVSDLRKRGSIASPPDPGVHGETCL
jgi:hypothetical protein